jgi:hypothetical protein
MAYPVFAADIFNIDLLHSLANGSYIDAIGNLDGKRFLLEWKTTTSRYPEEPNVLLALGSPADLLFLG